MTLTSDEVKKPMATVLKVKSLMEVLQQALTDGVTSAILMNVEGKQVAFSGGSEDQCDLVTAIVASAMLVVQRQGQVVLKGQSLQLSIMDFEGGRLCFTGVSSLILCLVGESDVPVGALCDKTRALKQFLQEPLSQLTAAP